MKANEKRFLSFLVILVVYVIATVAGIAIYKYLDESIPFYWRLLVADVIATIITFVFSVIFKNASVYDPYWSVQPPVILVAFAVGKQITPLRILLLVAVLFWAIRLTANWAYTFKGLDHQDWRYTMLKEKTKFFYPIVNFVGIHMVPTLIVYACILPAVFVFQSEMPLQFSWINILCFALSIFAATLQGIADIQMHKFRKAKSKDSSNTSSYGFIREGLWKNSRHPNYLGEILMWWGIGLSAFFAMDKNPVMLLGAFANTLLFLFISIPLAEGHQSRKEGFSQYKKETRMLLPIPKGEKFSSIIVKIILIIGVVIGVYASLIQEGYFNPSHFLYYTIQSNIEIGIISLITIICLLRNSGEVPNIVYVLKFIFTVAITLTGLVFNFILYPQSLSQDYAINPLTTANFFTHIFVPLLSLVDFFVFDYKLKITKKTFILGLITPLIYLGFVMICTKLGITFGGNRFVPYFFLDYRVNSWFQIGNGKIGVFYWIIIQAIIVCLISFVLTFFMKKRKKNFQ